jgi:integrase/recombinase XerD
VKLIDAVNEYIGYKRGLGIRFNTDARILLAMCRIMGTTTCLESMNEAKLKSFLAGVCSPTAFRNRNHYALLGFNRFVVGRGYSSSLPLPKMPPSKTRTFVPYVLSRGELRKLLDAIPRRPGRLLQPLTLRTLLLLLYGATLRISEATSLNLGDANLEDAIITVRETKFYKTRLVPLGPQLNQSMKVYADWREKDGHDLHPKAPLFVLSSGARANHVVVRSAFHRFRELAQIHHPDGQRPRLHDLRHSGAVHRLVAWYRQGADVQALLPKLAVYMGHVRLSSTQVYLTMTPELLEEVNLRFQKHAMSEAIHE